MKAATKKRFVCDLCLAAVSIFAGVVIGYPLGFFVFLYNDMHMGWVIWVSMALVTLGTFGLLNSLFPAPLNRASIEAKLRERYKLKEIHLTEKDSGQYEGTGTTTDGRMHKFLAVTQREQKLSWVDEDSEGGRKGDW